jgi:hypothetical protein
VKVMCSVLCFGVGLAQVYLAHANCIGVYLSPFKSKAIDGLHGEFLFELYRCLGALEQARYLNMNG